jgi:hypothetical protein
MAARGARAAAAEHTGDRVRQWRLGKIPRPGSSSTDDSTNSLATLPPHDFSLLVPHLRTLALERGVMLHDVEEQIERVYFPHTGMVSLVAVMQTGGNCGNRHHWTCGAHRGQRCIGGSPALARAKDANP